MKPRRTASIATIAIIAATMVTSCNPSERSEADPTQTATEIPTNSAPVVQQAVNRFPVVDRPTAVMASPIAFSDPAGGYDYTSVALDIDDRDIEFDFPITFNPQNTPDWAVQQGWPAGAGSDTSWAFKLFADEALTLELPVFAREVKLTGGSVMRLSSWEESAAENYVGYPAGGTVTLRDNAPVDGAERGGWGLYENYYLVRYIDDAGQPLERPVVSGVSFEQAHAAPRGVVVPDEEALGTIAIEWQPVEGAESYIVVKSTGDEGILSRTVGKRSYLALGTTTETSWSSSSITERSNGEPLNPDPARVDHQNAGLEMFQYSQDDQINDATTTVASFYQGVEFGVVAVMADGSHSPLGRFSSGRDVAAAPLKVAHNTWEALGGCDPCADAASIPVSFPYVSIDGKVRTAPAQISSEFTSPRAGYYSTTLVSKEMALEQQIAVSAADDAAYAALVADYNARAAAQAPAAGTVSAEVTDLVNATTPSAEVTPESLEKANGTNELVRYIGAHMLDGTEVIDVSAYNSWGLPAIADAVAEAYYQNPLGGVLSYQVNSRDSITLLYEDDRDARVTETEAKVEEVVASIITEGMSERDKATAINDYLVANLTYNHAAIDARQPDGPHKPEGFETSWTLSGAMLEGEVVCLGYSQGFKALADEAGLTSVLVTGAITSSSMRHAWNKVMVDGAWWSVDPTWNDSPAGNAYLLIPDSSFTGSATRTVDDHWVMDSSLGSYATP